MQRRHQSIDGWEFIDRQSDGYDDADLTYLSLESDNHEYIYEDTVIVVEEHGGSTTIFSLLFIAFTLVVRRVIRH